MKYFNTRKMIVQLRLYYKEIPMCEHFTRILIVPPSVSFVVIRMGTRVHFFASANRVCFKNFILPSWYPHPQRSPLMLMVEICLRNQQLHTKALGYSMQVLCTMSLTFICSFWGKSYFRWWEYLDASCSTVGTAIGEEYSPSQCYLSYCVVIGHHLSRKTAKRSQPLLTV